MTESKTESVREIRVNPVVPAESVLISTARGTRPRKAEEPPARDTRERVESCPFCRGNEHLTPPTILAVPDEVQWSVRIVENLYPVLAESAALTRGINFGLQQAIEGYGRHEVIIDHPRHGIAVHEMETEHLSLLFAVYRDRMRALYSANPRLKYVLVFKNYGQAAGASIPHTHSQIIATPVVPQNVHDEVENSRLYFRKHHHCIFCALIDEALTFEATIYDRDSGEIHRRIDVGQYVIERGQRFVAIKPFASRYEWEIQVLPLSHQSDYTALADDDLEDLARVVRRAMARLDAVVGGVQYNYFLHSLPHGPEFHDCAASYHWHLEICPRTSIPTGFELGSGLFVSTIAPEEAARRLREVVLQDG
ncbi:MAG: DUF4921 family protein [Proteobacteria bacterium]|nr:MAG: DUF4921 family protein [Pseudomonadota bacterium]QKK11403.1 MAG: DUF4921 family protein [Pseudomonadota bacterium]